MLSDGSFSRTVGHRLLGGVTRNASAFHGLCRWGIEETGPPGRYQFQQFTSTDASAVLTHGIELGIQTWHAFLDRMGWTASQVDKVICHQVGSAHRETILKALWDPGVEGFRDVSLPGKHRHGRAADYGRAGRWARVPGTRRPGWVPGDWKRAELFDVGAGVVRGGRRGREEAPSLK